MILEPGDLINNRYRITRYVGQGGMADVYRANDLINGQDVAIKLVRSDVENKEEFYERFSYEIRIAATITNHYNIVRILNFDKFDDRPFMVTEYISGQTLRDILNSKRTLDLKEACNYIIQILDALIELHSLGIVHRDIKPQNIYVLFSGIVKVADFGVSVFINNRNKKISEKRLIVGTPQYLAPEIIRTGNVSPQGDIYALGITFFELITGRVPFNDPDVKKTFQMHINNRLPSVSQLRHNCPTGIVNIIEKACAKNVKDRYQNAQEMKTDLEEILKTPKNLKTQNWLERLLGLKGK